MNQNSSMLDLVRKTCDDAEDMDDFEGVYEPDPEQVKEWQEREPETYDGKYKYVNMGPTKLRKMIEAGEELEAEPLVTAMRYWGMPEVYGDGATVAGTVDMGDEREAIYASSMQELAGNHNPVEHIFVGDLGGGAGVSRMSEDSDPSDYVDKGTIDWDKLLAMGPLPQTEDWF